MFLTRNRAKSKETPGILFGYAGRFYLIELIGYVILNLKIAFELADVFTSNGCLYLNGIKLFNL